jgi:hypothetical protein
VEYVEIFGFFQNSFALRKTPHDLLRSDSAQEARSAPMRGEAAFLGSTDRHAEQGSLQQFVSPRRMSKISQREKKKGETVRSNEVGAPENRINGRSRPDAPEQRPQNRNMDPSCTAHKTHLTASSGAMPNRKLQRLSRSAVDDIKLPAALS